MTQTVSCFAIAFTVVGLSACDGNVETKPASDDVPSVKDPSESQAAPGAAQDASAAAASSAKKPRGRPAVASVTWEPPADWKLGPKKPMRQLTYFLAGEDASSQAECAIFWFGEGMGGDPEANIKRWIGQMKAPAGKSLEEVTQRQTLNVEGGLKITIVDVTGAYNSSMKGEGEGEAGQRLVASVIEGGPQGMMFFKMTGPAKTVAKHKKAFVDLHKSMLPIALWQKRLGVTDPAAEFLKNHSRKK